MKPSTIEVWLWLLLVMCPYNRKTTELLEHFDSAEELACAIRDGNCPGLSEAEKQRARNIRSREVRSAHRTTFGSSLLTTRNTLPC